MFSLHPVSLCMLVPLRSFCHEFMTSYFQCPLVTASGFWREREGKKREGRREVERELIRVYELEPALVHSAVTVVLDRVSNWSVSRTGSDRPVSYNPTLYACKHDIDTK